MRRQRIAGRRQQSGAILVVSLLLLLVLTILGVTMMQTTRMQERMAGNTRDLSAALQGGEAALRYGEAQLQSYVELPATSTAADCATAGANIVCDRNVLPLAIYDPSVFDWTSKAKVYGTATATTTSLPQLASQPQYTNEHINWVPDSLNVGDSDAQQGRDFYQLTGHSTGVSGQANVIVRSTYVRRF